MFQYITGSCYDKTESEGAGPAEVQVKNEQASTCLRRDDADYSAVRAACEQDRSSP